MATAAIHPDRFGGAGQRPQGLALTYQRLMLMMLVFAGVTLLIAGRLLFLQLFTDRASAGRSATLCSAARRHRRPQRRAAGADDRRLVDRHPSNRLLGDPAELAGEARRS